MRECGMQDCPNEGEHPWNAWHFCDDHFPVPEASMICVGRKEGYHGRWRILTPEEFEKSRNLPVGRSKEDYEQRMRESTEEEWEDYSRFCEEVFGFGVSTDLYKEAK